MTTTRMVMFLALMLGFSGAFAADFDEGIEYTRVNSPVATANPDKVVVTEIFWYGCPHCFRFEPYIEKWKKNMPEGVVLEQVPSVLNPSWMEHARAYYALSMMGKNEETHAHIFNALHLQNRRLNNVDALADFVATRGVDAAEFRKHYYSFPVDTMIRKSRKKERQYGHRGVPAVVVNGKYRTSASMAGSNARMMEVVNYLVNKELAAK